MSKKQKKIQLVLVLFGLFLIFATYFYYPYMKKLKLTQNESTPDDLEIAQKEKDDESTSFENVKYDGIYNTKPFTVEAENAYILKEETSVNRDMIQKAYSATNKMCELYKEKAEMEELGREIPNYRNFDYFF